MPRAPKTAAQEMRSREIYSLERMSLGWAWNDARNAAQLAAELLVWATPDVDVDGPEATDARSAVSTVIVYLRLLAEGAAVTAPVDVGREDEHPMTRLYWYAETLGKHVEQTCEYAARAVHRQPSRRDQWRWLGHAGKCATEFIRKFATQNPVIGAIDGAAGGILNRISAALAYSGKPTDEITGRMFDRRVHDALKGKELSSEMAANLRPAFEAAWSAGEYEFAYSLLADLDTLAALPP
jgi:hypothetical protein